MTTLTASYHTTETTRAQSVRGSLLHLLLGYVLLHLFFRSFSNGVDIDYQTSLSAGLSVIVIGVAALSFVVSRDRPAVGRIPLAFLVLTIVIGAAGALLLDLPRPADALNTMGRYAALAGTIVVLDVTSSSRRFLPAAMWLFRALLFAYAFVAFVQFATGRAYFVELTDPFARIRGYSAHPVSFSIEIVVIALVAEICRIRLGHRLTPLLLALYAFAGGALLLSASRTGLAILGVAVLILCARRGPGLALGIGAVGVGLVLLTPLGRLFTDLQSLPEYVLGGHFTTWDYRYADSSVHWRIHHWYYLSKEAFSSPILGYGIGQTLVLSPFLKEAHSIVVETFFEQGILGVIAMAGFWSSLFFLPFRPGFHGSTDADPSLVRARSVWIALLVGFLLAGIAGSSVNRDTVALSHLMVGLFALRAPLPSFWGPRPAASRPARFGAGNTSHNAWEGRLS